jgi:hypothetical protein
MKRWFSLLLLVACGASAAEACQPVRVGYSDRERVPYYMGNGSEVPDKPGVLVELIREAFRSVGCPVVLVRRRWRGCGLRWSRRHRYCPGRHARRAAMPATWWPPAPMAPSTASARWHHRLCVRAPRGQAVACHRSDAVLQNPYAGGQPGHLLAAQLKAAGLQVDDGSFSSGITSTNCS